MIEYAVICRKRDAAVLVEVLGEDLSGNVPAVTIQLMEHLRDHPDVLKEGERKTFLQRNQVENDFFSHFLEACAAAMGDTGTETDFFFHLCQRDGVVYCCLADDPDINDQKVCFAFLDNIHGEFVKMFRAGRIANANAYALDKQFAPTVRAAMHYHNIHQAEIRKEERVSVLLAKVTNMKDVMGRNITMLLDRGENLDKMVSKSQALRDDAAVFRKSAVLAKRRQRRKYYFMVGIMSLIVGVLIYMVVIGICGEGLEYCRARNSQSNQYYEGGQSSQYSGGNQYSDGGQSNQQADGGQN